MNAGLPASLSTFLGADCAQFPHRAGCVGTPQPTPKTNVPPPYNSTFAFRPPNCTHSPQAGCLQHPAPDYDRLAVVPGRVQVVDYMETTHLDSDFVQPNRRQCWSVQFADYDRDGDMDMLVAVGNVYGSRANYESSEADTDPLQFDAFNIKTRVYKNDGTGRFLNTDIISIGDNYNSFFALWGDVNNDGWVDILEFGTKQELRYGSHLNPHSHVGGGNHKVYVSQCAVGSCDVFDEQTSSESGLSTSTTYLSQYAALGDYDNDGWIDLLVGVAPHRDMNGAAAPNQLYRNRAGASGAIFQQITATSTCSIISQYAGRTNQVAWGDFDGDGRIDALVANRVVASDSSTIGNELHRNLGTAPGETHFEAVVSTSRPTRAGALLA